LHQKSKPFKSATVYFELRLVLMNFEGDPMLPYTGLEKVISGAQTGADRAGLLAAEQLGIATGGFMPKGFLASDGKQPLFAARFGIEEHKSPLYPPRTRDNIRAACATLCLEGQCESKGVVLTRNLAIKANKPLLRIQFQTGPAGELTPSCLPDQVQAWIRQLQIRVLNIAGNEESKAPGLQLAAWAFLFEVLKPWAPTKSPIQSHFCGNSPEADAAKAGT
jgi:hypothetical protein